ncbi:PTS sugar transporter subunit IIB [Alkalicella caledoniensis]|uniref:PTS sugar transporter subunit IIB n=1 Tax=Alkalicella caledoniensis TaxID=2731377 RepID=A0A7G9W8Q9_ALKCA|nr:PTS sugar transporter subunit IIB [Alkalicella caledoniensis]QNO15071.1 PTS sugar transporter subunit IIB [Alkalicella caledoniensis]
MIKILLCCAGGFSSSSLSTKLEKEIKESNLQNEFYIEFSPFLLSLSKISEFDIIVCCPHLRLEVQKLVKESNPDIPIYILPPRMYGVIYFKDLALDVTDIIDMYNKNKTNPVHFPGEEHTLRITRNVAYRNYKK